MSTFKVEVVAVGPITEHDNADTLSLTKVYDYHVVIGKNDFKEGDLAVFFPVDSVIPDTICDVGRVRTVTLRGKVSQGLLMPIGILPAGEYSAGADVTELLGVTKYEPPVVEGASTPLPGGVEVYDIESAQRWIDIVGIMLDKHVIITEKLEGTHVSVTCNKEGTFVCSHRRTVDEQSMYFKEADKAGMVKLARSLRLRFGMVDVTLRGEIIGPKIQGNHYGLDERQVRLFDIKSNGKYLPYDEARRTHAGCVGYNGDNKWVPTIYRGVLRDWLGTEDMLDRATAPSLLNPSVLREGVVIQPSFPEWDESIGRMILKVRSPEYLAGSGN